MNKIWLQTWLEFQASTYNRKMICVFIMCNTILDIIGTHIIFYCVLQPKVATKLVAKLYIFFRDVQSMAFTPDNSQTVYKKRRRWRGMKIKEDLTFFFSMKGFDKFMMAWLDQCMHSTKKICGTLPCNLYMDI